MLTPSCREVGTECDYVCNAETEEEIMENAKQHAVLDHHYNVEDSRTTAENKFTYKRLDVRLAHLQCTKNGATTTANIVVPIKANRKSRSRVIFI